MKGRLNSDYVVHFWLQCLKDSIEFPAATRALVDDELNLGLEGTQRLKSKVKEDRLIR